jgi:hypothetical protein
VPLTAKSLRTPHPLPPDQPVAKGAEVKVPFAVGQGLDSKLVEFSTCAIETALMAEKATRKVNLFTGLVPHILMADRCLRTKIKPPPRIRPQGFYYCTDGFVYLRASWALVDAIAP